MHPSNIKTVLALLVFTVEYGVFASPLQTRITRHPIPSPVNSQDLLGRGKSPQVNQPQSSVTTMIHDGIEGVFKAAQNIELATLRDPRATTMVTTITVDGKAIPTSLPVIVGPGGWFWEPQLKKPDYMYPYWPVESPPRLGIPVTLVFRVRVLAITVL